jgi:hypothetical protein
MKVAAKKVPAAFKAQQAKAKATQDPGKPGMELVTKQAAMLQKAKLAGVPDSVAKAMVALMSKQAEDAINPAVIVAGTAPELQQASGIPSQLSQGVEAGEGTPRECAPNVGEGSGRELLSSNESAINATKAQAKAQNKPPLGEVLTEPALSAAHDKVLSESLDNTSSAGVKISAARELLRKFASQSRENAYLLSELVKAAEGEIPAGPVAPEGLGDAGLEGPGLEGGPEGAGLEDAAPPSDEALEAAQAGVTPEELLQAHALLAVSQEAAGQASEAGAGGPPAAAVGGEEGEKGSQMGLPGGSSAMGTSPSPMSPTF